MSGSFRPERGLQRLAWRRPCVLSHLDHQVRLKQQILDASHHLVTTRVRHDAAAPNLVLNDHRLKPVGWSVSD